MSYAELGKCQCNRLSIEARRIEFLRFVMPDSTLENGPVTSGASTEERTLPESVEFHLDDSGIIPCL